MTHEAISRRTNVPLDILKESITKLESPDPKSRSKEFNGARIIRLDAHRDWGWVIVNYHKYRGIRCEDDRKAYKRNWIAQKRKAEKSSKSELVDQCRHKGDPSPSPSTSFSNLEGGLGEGATEVPTLEQAIAQTMSMAIPEDFCRYVYSKWVERDGRDGSGQLVDWFKHVKGRWEREGVSWRNGTHTGQVNYSKVNGNGHVNRESIPIWKKEKILQEAIDRHPANSGSAHFKPNCTDEQKAKLKMMRDRLRQIREELAKTITDGH